MGRLVGCAHGHLAVTETNGSAVAFYERLGFVDIGDRHRLREGSDLAVRVMSRAL